MNALRLHPDGGGSSITVQGPLTRIGRDPANDIVLRDASVSRHHAEIEFRDGSWQIFDLNSSNGVKLDGRLVPESRLSSGQRLEIGSVRFAVEVDIAGDGATVVLGRSPLLDDAANQALIRSLPASPARQAPPSDSLGALATVVVAVALLLAAVEANDYLSRRNGTMSAPEEPPPAAPPFTTQPPEPTVEVRRPERAVTTAPRPSTGAILVSTDLPALISVDGKSPVRLGANALKRFDVAPGDHVVRYRADGWELDVVAHVRAGEQTLVRPGDETAAPSPGPR